MRGGGYKLNGTLDYGEEKKGGANKTKGAVEKFSKGTLGGGGGSKGGEWHKGNKIIEKPGKGGGRRESRESNQGESGAT